MKLPESFNINTPTGLYTIIHRPRHSGLEYELYEVWNATGVFHRHLNAFELNLLKAGFEMGIKEGKLK